MQIIIEVPDKFEDELDTVMKDIMSLKLGSYVNCSNHHNIIFTCVTDDNTELTIDRAKCVMDSYQQLYDQLHNQTIEHIIMNSMEQATLETIAKNNFQQLN